jgi:hypothetical protein
LLAQDAERTANEPYSLLGQARFVAHLRSMDSLPSFLSGRLQRSEALPILGVLPAGGRWEEVALWAVTDMKDDLFSELAGLVGPVTRKRRGRTGYAEWEDLWRHTWESGRT